MEGRGWEDPDAVPARCQFLLDSAMADDAAPSKPVEYDEIDISSHYWRQVPVIGTVPLPRHAFVHAVYKDKFYVVGGYGQGGVYLSDSWVLDLKLQSWNYFSTRIAPTNPAGWLLPPMHSTACAQIGSKLYAFGGITQKGQHLGNLMALEIETGSWSNLPSNNLPRPRWGATLNEYGGQLYCFGGFGDRFYNDLWRYDPASNTWTELNPLGAPPPRHYHSATVYGDLLYIIGGYRGSAFTADIWSYEFATNRWLKVAGQNALSNRRGHSSVLVPERGSCLIFGGRDDRRRLSDIIEYKFDGDRYTVLRSVGDNPDSRLFHASFFFQGSMYVFGGLNIYNSNQLLQYIYEPMSDPASSPKGARIDYTMLWKNPELSDVSFRFGEASVPAHKVILYAASETFRALFKSGMKDATDGIVELGDDISRETFEQILYFIYTGKVQRLTAGNLLELLVASDKFLLTELTEHLQRAIAFALNKENVAQILRFSLTVPSARDVVIQHCVRFLKRDALIPSFSECLKILKKVNSDTYNDLKEFGAREAARLEAVTEVANRRAAAGKDDLPSPSTSPPLGRSNGD